MKTSSYDEEDDVTEEFVQEAAVYEAQTDYEESVAQNYEASFAKCKVAPIVESNEEETEESFETAFAKCTVSSADKEKTDKCREEEIADSYRTPIVESIEIVKVESNEAPVANVTPQYDITPNVPPPVPKRTLLPTKTAKETTAPDTPQNESTAEETDVQNVAYRDIELVSPEEITQRTETGERWSDSTSVSLPGQVEDVETVSSDPGNVQCDPVSEMYYTASSEVSLLSDTEVAVADKAQNEEDEQTKDDRKNVIAGHVAAMRERFESMTRTNTPCPDLVRSLSPSLEVFRNMSPSPDRLA